MAKKSSGSSGIVEDIELNLETNFEAELLKTATQYDHFQKRASSISRSIGTSVGSMYKQVSTNLNVMMGDTQRTVATAINMTRGSMRSIQNESIALTKTYEKYVDRMLQRQKEVRAIVSDPTKSSKQVTKDISGVVYQANQDTMKTTIDLYSKLGKAAQESSTNISTAMKNSLGSVKELSLGIKDKIADIQVALSNEKSLASVFSAKEGIAEIEKQMKVADNAVKEQAKRTIEAERQMQAAKLALTQITNRKMAAENAVLEKEKEVIAIQSARKIAAEKVKATKDVAERANAKAEYDKGNIAYLSELTKAKKQLALAKQELADSGLQKLKEEQEAYFQTTVKNNTQAQQSYKATMKVVDELAAKVAAAKQGITTGVSKIVGLQSNDALNLVKNIDSKAVFGSIEKQYNDLFNKFKTLRNEKFISSKTVEEFRSQVKSMDKSVYDYNLTIKALRDNLRVLEQLNRKGLAPNIGPDIERGREQLRELEANAKKITAMSNRATSEAETLAKNQSKSFISTAWESIRNFRWQVAAISYLVTKSVQLVKNTFIKVLDEVQKFRTSSMAIAASIAYSMLDDVGTSFNKAFEYSKDLMLRLEREAARTILTLEDMTMLTKTFVQAGIIPKTDEDVKKISTIGTAIKILTEGMANAGVQMRQELYAIILGRQRATDQVAMMFKMIGININDVLKKAKKEGKDMLDVLSEALKPFEAVNDAMANDYVVQLEALQKIYSKITRIGADNTYKQISKSLKEINDLLMDSKGNLTALGLDGAVALGILMESIRLTVKFLGQMFAGFSGNGEVADRLVWVYARLAQMLGLVAIGFDATGTSLRVLTLEISEAFYLLREALTKGPLGDFELLREYYSELRDEAWADLGKRTGDLAIDIENSIKRLQNLKNPKSTFEDGIGTYRMPYPQMAETFSTISNEIKTITKQGLDGAAKIEEEYNQGLEKAEELKYQAEENVKSVQAQMAKSAGNPEAIKKLQKQLEAPMEALRKLEEYDAALKQKRSKQYADQASKEIDKIAGVRAEYENLLESMKEAPTTPLEQVEKKYTKLGISLEKFIAQNKEYFAKAGVDIQALQNALAEGLKASTEGAIKEMNEAYKAFIDSMSSHRVLDPLKQIDNEFEKIRNNITKSNDLTVVQKSSALALLEVYKKERKELALINLELEKQKAQARMLKAKADVFEISIRPIDKQVAAIINLKAAYKESSASITQEIDKINKEWENNITNMPASETIRIASLKKELEYLGIAFDEHLKDVQEPFWKDMKDMAQGWGDSFADILTEAAYDLDSFSDNFDNFIEQIGKDVTKAFIKRNLTDPLIDFLSSPFNKNTQASGEEVKESGADGGLASDLFSIVKSGFKSVFEIGGELFNGVFSWVKGLFGETGVFGGIAEWFSGLFSETGMFGGVAKWFGELFGDDGMFGGITKWFDDMFTGIGDFFNKSSGGSGGSIFDKIMGMFGGGEKSSGGGGSGGSFGGSKGCCCCCSGGGSGGFGQSIGPAQEAIDEVNDTWIGINNDIIGDVGDSFGTVSESILSEGKTFSDNMTQAFDGISKVFQGFTGDSPINYAFGGSSGLWGDLLSIGSGIMGAIGGGSSAAGSSTAYGAGALDYMGSGYETGPFIGFADGGIISEPIVGRGLRSGSSYSFGEGGIKEAVVPMNSLQNGASKQGIGSLSINIPVSVDGSGMTNKMISKLKSELHEVVKTTTLKVIGENV